MQAAGTNRQRQAGKLFTALSEGYTGWYANGNNKTYAIDNISITESIVGRTNIEVTEPFWFGMSLMKIHLDDITPCVYRYYSYLIQDTVSRRQNVALPLPPGIRVAGM